MHHEAMLRFALSLHQMLLCRFDSESVRLQSCLVLIFKPIDRFYLQRFTLPCMADQLRAKHELIR